MRDDGRFLAVPVAFYNDGGDVCGVFVQMGPGKRLVTTSQLRPPCRDDRKGPHEQDTPARPAPAGVACGRQRRECHAPVHGDRRHLLGEVHHVGDNASRSR